MRGQRDELIQAIGLTIGASSDRDLVDLDSDTSELIVHANSCNETTNLSLPLSLVVLEIQDNALVQCACLELTNLDQLRSITIGANCFTSSETMSPSKRFSLSSCAALQTLVIGNYSFSDFGTFILSGLSMLKEVTLGDNAFCCFESVVIESSRWTVSLFSDCSSLTAIHLGTNALQGNASSTVSVIMKGTFAPFDSPKIFLFSIRSLVREATSRTPHLSKCTVCMK